MWQISPLQTIAIGILLVIFACAYTWRSKSDAGRQLPPGPPGIPLIGNMLQVPDKHIGTYFKRVLEEYGGLAALSTPGDRIVLIGDIELAKVLFEKRSAKHSSRPTLTYVKHHFDPLNNYWAAGGQGENFVTGRKLTTTMMSFARTGKTEPLQKFEALLNIQHLLDDGGKDWFHHMERIVASSTLAAGFGMHCPTADDPILRETMDVVIDAIKHLGPLISIINFLPFLNWIPGPTPWRKGARETRKREDAVYKNLVNEALTGKASGMNTWAASFARKGKPEGDQTHLLNQVVIAAIDTTTGSLQSFVLACIRYPEWIAAAQREIDHVVGPDRLPTFEDRPFMPYVEAVVRVRFGLPHKSTADDVIEYQGKEYFIPKGSILISVPWRIEHDQSKFKDPDSFNPGRFLDAEGKLKPDYATSAFGFGRRVCPGIPFASRALWINLAMMLWTFNIRGSDEINIQTGLPFQYDDSDEAFCGDLTTAPIKFPAVFEPRSTQRADIARREWADCEKDLNVLLPAPKETWK